MQNTVSFWDFGSNMSQLYTREGGSLVREATYVATRTDTHACIFFGNEAYQLIDKTPSQVACIALLRDGFIAEEELLGRFIARWSNLHTFLFRPSVVVSVPSMIDATHKRALKRACMSAGYGRVILLPTVLVISVFHTSSGGKKAGIVVDMGDGKVEMACIANNRIVEAVFARMGGRKLEETIRLFIETKYGIACGPMDIRRVLQSVSLQKNKMVRSVQIRGKDIGQNQLATIVIRQEDILPVVENFLNDYVALYQQLLQKLSPTMIQEIAQTGLLLSGGLSKMDGIVAWFATHLHVPICQVARPELAPVLGSARVFSQWDEYAYMQL